MKRAAKIRWVFLGLLAIVCGLTPRAREFTVFDVVGDSVSFGLNPDYPGTLTVYGWVHMLQGAGGFPWPPPMDETIFTLWPEITSFNSAVGGTTAADWVETGNPFLPLVLAHHPDLVAVMIGGNDFRKAHSDDGIFSLAEQEQLRANISLLIEQLQALEPAPEIIIVGYYDLFDGFSHNHPLPKYVNYSPDTVIGNGIMHAVARRYRCIWLPIADEFMHHAYGRDLGDTGHLLPDYFRLPLIEFNIHPITPGHAQIYELMQARLARLKLSAEPGDANADGAVDDADAGALADYVAGNTVSLPAAGAEAAELDGTDGLTAADLAILEIILLPR